MKQKIAVFWFRRDLRLYDNHALFHALNQDIPVLPIFIFDKFILEKLNSISDKRVTFIHSQLFMLNAELIKNGSSLKIFHDTPEMAFKDLIKEFDIVSVYANKDYEPYSINRDNKIGEILRANKVNFYLFKDHVIFDEDEILNINGNPYTVFTPYYKKWSALLEQRHVTFFPSEKLADKFLKLLPFRFPSLNELGFVHNKADIPVPEIHEHIIRNYAHTRDFPAIQGTSGMGIHLRFGTISIRELVLKAIEWSDIYLKELAWREFFSSVLWHFPHVIHHSFKSEYDRIQWRNEESEFERWCNGETGYPIVDAGMRELNSTGFMHNRIRMITAGFLSKHLLIDWRWGEAYFAEKLLDFDLASNNGNWQWAAGTGCDASPWFRIFNPIIQQHKFDPKAEYIKKWVPEFETSRYIKPIVEHKLARERAIRTYQSAIKNE